MLRRLQSVEARSSRAVLQHANPRLLFRSADFFRNTARVIVVDLVRARLGKAITHVVGASSVSVGVDVWKSEESRDSFVTTTLHAVRRDFSGLFSCVIGALPIEAAHTGDNIFQVAEDGQFAVSVALRTVAHAPSVAYVAFCVVRPVHHWQGVTCEQGAFYDQRSRQEHEALWDASTECVVPDMSFFLIVFVVPWLAGSFPTSTRPRLCSAGPIAFHSHTTM